MHVDAGKPDQQQQLLQEQQQVRSTFLLFLCPTYTIESHRIRYMHYVLHTIYFSGDGIAFDYF